MTEKNEMGSVSHAAARCVELPAELMSERLCVVYLYFRQWTGTVSMCQDDYSVGKDGSLPPQQVAANYGQKRVIDPKYLRVFEALKKRAESLLADHGLPFCKGTVIPLAQAKVVLTSLADIARDYNKERDAFVAQLEERSQEWINRNPDFAEQIKAASPVAKDIATRINADFAVMRFQPLGPEVDVSQSLNRAVDGLFAEVIADVAKRSAQLYRRSVFGKKPEDLSQRTLSAIKTMRVKLTGLRFLNSGVGPIIALLDRLLGILPAKGKFSVHQYNAFNAALGLLRDEAMLREVALGKQTLDEYLACALPETRRALPTLESVGKPFDVQAIKNPSLSDAQTRDTYAQIPDLTRELELCFEAVSDSESISKTTNDPIQVLPLTGQSTCEDQLASFNDVSAEIPPAPSTICLSHF